MGRYRPWYTFQGCHFCIKINDCSTGYFVVQGTSVLFSNFLFANQIRYLQLSRHLHDTSHTSTLGYVVLFHLSACHGHQSEAPELCSRRILLFHNRNQRMIFIPRLCSVWRSPCVEGRHFYLMLMCTLLFLVALTFAFDGTSQRYSADLFVCTSSRKLYKEVHASSESVRPISEPVLTGTVST